MRPEPRLLPEEGRLVSVVYFTSDPHIGHRWVANLRGFETSDDHDQWFCDMWNDTVHSRDQVWILGDLSVGQLPYMLDTLARLPGVKNLVAGNHDPCHPMFREAPRYQRKYLDVFRSVQPMARVKTHGHEVLLSHFPYPGTRESDHTEPERYTQWRLPDMGDWLLHGHVHSKLRVHGRQIHVGLDAWGRLVSAKEIAGLIGEAEALESASAVEGRAGRADQ